ncbi:MAG: YihY family inner membrane protein [Spirochaetes bacterium]|nr:YihY family inner membrane protein [Spirochaetota bacterium]
MKLKEKTKILVKKANAKVTNIKKMIDEIYSGDSKYNKKIINTYKVMVASSKKFLEDDCLTKASSIAYTTLISLIPTLTVVLTVYYSFYKNVGDQKNEFFSTITTFLVDHNIKINIDPVLETISGLIDNAGKIGGIGAVILIFSATAVLRTLDKSLNDIWKIKTGRTILLKIIYFWAALSLGPILIISGSTLASQATSMLSSPSSHSADITDEGTIWAVGSKANIVYSKNSVTDFTPVNINQIDLENQEVYNFDANSKSFIMQEFKVEELEYDKAEFRDIQFIKNQGWIVGKNGLFLFTSDKGKSWELKKFGNFGLNDIHMLDENNGFITADNGYLLFTGDNWEKLEIKEWNDINVNLKSISFYNNYGIITGERGLIITTNDNGKTWEWKNIPEAKVKKTITNINSAHFINKDQIILACDEGIILFSNDSGETWEKKKYSDTNYYSISFIDKSTGYLAGSKGMIVFTVDGGQNWRKKDLSIGNINSLKIFNNTIWAFGDNGMILRSIDNGITWEGEKGKSVILYLSNFFAPFILIWLLFLLIYIFFPNTKVPFKPAAIGAAFTGLVWVIFILLFEIYIKAFAKSSFAIYGALAAIPIFLLMVYTSFLIVLFGAEVSYTLMHPHTYLQLKKPLKIKNNIHLFYGISILHFIYNKFEKGKGHTSYKELLKITLSDRDELNYFLEIFKKENIIAESDENLSPSNSSKNIYLSDIIELIHDVSLYVPGIISSRDKLKKIMENLFNKIKKSKEGIIGEITLADLIERT